LHTNAFTHRVVADHFAGKTVIELGAGTGLVGIALAKLGMFILGYSQRSES
jgi:predicted nicotinamide N-methyase